MENLISTGTHQLNIMLNEKETKVFSAIASRLLLEEFDVFCIDRFLGNHIVKYSIISSHFQ